MNLLAIVKRLSSLKVLGMLSAGALFLSSCSSSQPVQKSNLSYGTVKKSIIKGKTNQAEIVQLLGSPNIVTKNTKGEEVWTYSKQSYDSESGGFGGGILLFGGSKAFSSSASSTFDLIITYDNKDVVKDYAVVSSQF